jgi:hypothetical protein
MAGDCGRVGTSKQMKVTNYSPTGLFQGNYYRTHNRVPNRIILVCIDQYIDIKKLVYADKLLMVALVDICVFS